MKSKVLAHLPSKSRPYLLALSGGADSMALFHLMKEAGISFAAMTIDHGWREESGEEVKALCAMCQKCSIPFFSEKIEGFDFSLPNIEDRLRNARYAILRKKAEEFEALVTAHHRDDCVETTLKRIFEGARLTHLYGMSTTTGGVIRPLIDVTKEEILAWLKERAISYFHDVTNDDQAYLRSRMRHTLIPTLEEQFGKNIQENLAQISKRSLELKEYLDRKIAPYLAQFDGEVLDLEPLSDRVELKHLLSSIAPFNRSQLETVISMIEKGISNKHIQVGNRIFTYKKHQLHISKS